MVAGLPTIGLKGVIAVLHAGSGCFLFRIVGFRKALGQLRQVVWDLNCIEQLVVVGARVIFVNSWFTRLHVGAVLVVLGKQLCYPLADLRELEQLSARRSQFGLDAQHSHDGIRQVFGVLLRDFLVGALQHSLVEPVHILSPEGWLESSHFIDHTAKGPNIGLAVVRLILPDLRGSIIRCSRLGIKQPLLSNLRDIQVAQLG
mmetsp:Transcript_11534/g.17392  ORF Transcript_11534/g.17392 Transcript_11534/m.17392 type:complete len:202 (-) Transcript_11534:470-1075(-)